MVARKSHKLQVVGSSPTPASVLEVGEEVLGCVEYGGHHTLAVL